MKNYAKENRAQENRAEPLSVELARWAIERADEVLDVDPDVLRDSLKLATKLRKRFDADETRALCSIAETRRKAGAKFANASRMFFTPVGYEQATSQAIAQYKARRFEQLRRPANENLPIRNASRTSNRDFVQTPAGKNSSADPLTRRQTVDGEAAIECVDLCCGIGGDAIWLAEHANLTVVDRQETCVEFALANLRLHNRKAQGITKDLRQVELERFHAWHIDPDRRLNGNRRSTPNACEPPLDEFLSLPGLSQHGAIKLAPAADASSLLSMGAELEWIGCQQECRQQVAWFGDLARHPGKRTATWILGAQHEVGGAYEQLVETQASVRESTEPKSFLYEPRASVIAAGLTEDLASRFELERIPNTAYLVGDTRQSSILFRRFRVLESGAFHHQTLVQRLSALQLRVTEVKKRNVDVDPETLLRQLSAIGEPSFQNAVVIMFPQGTSVRYAIASRDDED